MPSTNWPSNVGLDTGGGNSHHAYGVAARAWSLDDAAVTFQALAAGKLDETELTEWIACNMQALERA